MKMKKNKGMMEKLYGICLAAVLSILPLEVLAQGTRIEIPRNRYSLQQDVQLGRQAANEVKRQLPLLPENSDVVRYVSSVGRRLVAAIPPQYQQPAFDYRFDVVNASDINAFALPGGPMFVNRGMIENARNEGEMAGVMAHELSHVVLRHGTAQASERQSAKFQLPALGGAILGAIIGGNIGGIISQGTQLGVGAYLLKYSRAYESQADILGAQIMARAGYDPRDLANMFRTIERASGPGGPEWLSSHPNPGNRYDRIEQEASKLRVNRSAGGSDSRQFNQIKAELQRMAPASTTSQIQQSSASRRQSSPQAYPAGSRIESRIDNPSTNYQSYRAGNAFQINVPSNWERFNGQDSLTFAPRGAYGNFQGQPVFTHGVIAGLVNPQTSNLENASDRYVGALLRNNSYLQPQNRYRSSNIDGHRALSISLAGRSPVTGRTEVVNVYTTLLSNGQLFYLINVAPREDYPRFQRSFGTVLRSVSLR